VRHIEEPSPALRALLTEMNGHIRDIRLLDVNDMQRLKNYLQVIADIHGTQSAKVTRSVIANIINLAIGYGVLTTSALRNVPAVTAQGRKGPKPVRNTKRALTRDERTALLAYADAKATEAPYDPRTRRKWQTAADILAFMAGTGARLRCPHAAVGTGGRGLCWCHRDRQWHRGQPRPRHVDFNTDLADRMRRRYAATGGSGYLFASPAYLDSDHEWDQSNCAKALNKLILGAGFPWVTPHSLRRTAATLAHLGGAPLIAIADQLGDADPNMTGRVYLGQDFQGPRQSVAALL
jgi:integrase